jgi:hypothetical protein
MITTGSKWYFGLGFVLLVLAAAYGWTTGGNGLGPLSVGYKGGVGDHFGYGLLLSAAAVSLLLGLVSTAARDADAEAQAQVAGTETVPPVIPATPSYWPAVAAFGAALFVIGLVSQAVFVVAGLSVIGIVLVEWAVQTWADRATGDPEVNRRLRNRLMNPIEFPAAGVLILGTLALAFAGVFLALSAEAAVWVAMVFALVIVVAGFFVASRPRISSNVVVGLLLVGAVVAIGLGVASGIAGKREFHEHGTEEEGHEGEEGALGAAGPVVVEVAR